MTRPREPEDTVSFGEAAAIGRIERALFGGDERLVRVGRYEVIEAIGAGAFGKVYRARDPQLARTIALKVLDVERASEDDLLSEAKVMATIGHPNVAAIHDAGVLADTSPPRVFIAMELVEGESLRGWLATPRHRDAILDVMRQAGRGLAAAHAAGVVHRDFKPENLVVGADGRVRVVDFGLARAAGTAIPADVDLVETATGTVAGTPAYMAPELFAGGVASARSDQFAFCVTLWEALCGARPFAATTVDELRAAFGRPLVLPRRRVPRPITRALVRGLASAPAERHPSMDALVRALEPRRSRRWLAAAGVAIGGLAAALALVVSRVPPEAPDPCPRATAELAGVWDDARKAAIGAAFRATGLPQAQASFVRLSDILDRVSGEWLDARHAACTATHVRHEQSAELLDRRMACLREWRRQLAALTARYARASPAIVTQATRATNELPALARCSNEVELAAGPPRPSDPAVAAKVDALNDRLADARISYVEGEHADALAIVADVGREAEALRDETVQVAATLLQGQALIALGRYAEARDVAKRSFDLALGVRDHRSAALAASVLAFNGAFDSSLAAESLQWIRTGQSLRTKLDNADDVEAALAHVEGNVYLTAADPANARTALERSVAAWRRLDSEHANLSTTLGMLGVAMLNLGQVEPARAHLVEAVTATERDLGPTHPELAASLVNLALVEGARGRYRDAAASLERGLAIQIGALGEDHPLVGYTHLNRGQVAFAMGDRAIADREYDEARRIAQAGTNAVFSVVVELAAGEFRARTGRGAAAREHARRMLAAIDADDHGPRALGEATLALAEHALGHRAAALATARTALAQIAASSTATPSQRAIVHCIVGEIFVAHGRRADAIPILRLADDELGHGPPDPFRRARIRLALARATRDPAATEEAIKALPADVDPALRAR